MGYDVHKLVEGRDLWLGGIKIPHTVGLLGHSDADVALHAVSDAFLGALALGDIGMHFPDNDDRYLGADSANLLKKVLAMPEFSRYSIASVDLTVVAQRPKLAPYREKMRRRLSEITGCAFDRVSVKFTTTEKMGFTGSGEGIAAFATVLLAAE